MPVAVLGHRAGMSAGGEVCSRSSATVTLHPSPDVIPVASDHHQVQDRHGDLARVATHLQAVPLEHLELGPQNLRVGGRQIARVAVLRRDPQGAPLPPPPTITGIGASGRG